MGTFDPVPWVTFEEMGTVRTAKRAGWLAGKAQGLIVRCVPCFPPALSVPPVLFLNREQKFNVFYRALPLKKSFGFYMQAWHCLDCRRPPSPLACCGLASDIYEQLQK
jgi:hypothetical protein